MFSLRGLIEFKTQDQRTHHLSISEALDQLCNSRPLAAALRSHLRIQDDKYTDDRANKATGNSSRLNFTPFDRIVLHFTNQCYQQTVKHLKIKTHFSHMVMQSDVCALASLTPFSSVSFKFRVWSQLLKNKHYAINQIENCHHAQAFQLYWAFALLKKTMSWK